LPTLYYIPNDDVIAAENKILEKDEVDWPELTEHRRRVDEELEQQKKDHQPYVIQVWFTDEQTSLYVIPKADLSHRRSHQRRWRYR